MEWVELRYEDLFRELSRARIRYLLIGRRALILLGAPVQTLDIDILLSPDREDLSKLLAVASSLGIDLPPIDLEQAPPFFKLQADNTHVDCFRARRYETQDGEALQFETMWRDRQTILLGEVEIPIPSLDDLIRTKRLRQSGSPKSTGDQTDIRYLVAFKELQAKAQGASKK